MVRVNPDGALKVCPAIASRTLLTSVVPLWSPPAPTYAGPPGRFHRIVGHHRIGIRQLVRFGIRAIIGDEGFVGRIIDGFKVVPCREVADQRFGIDAAQLLFPTEKATTGTSVAFRPG